MTARSTAWKAGNYKRRYRGMHLLVMREGRSWFWRVHLPYVSGTSRTLAIAKMKAERAVDAALARAKGEGGK